MPAGRRKNIDPPVDWKISIPESVAGQFELLALDPLTGKPRYGVRAEVIADLIRGLIASCAGDEEAMQRALKQAKLRLGFGG